MFKKAKTAILTGTALVASSVPAFAVGTADTSVVTGLTTAQENAAATFAAVVGIGLTLWATPYIITYAKRFFTKISH